MSVILGDSLTVKVAAPGNRPLSGPSSNVVPLTEAAMGKTLPCGPINCTFPAAIVELAGGVLNCALKSTSRGTLTVPSAGVLLMRANGVSDGVGAGAGAGAGGGGNGEDEEPPPPQPAKASAVMPAPMTPRNIVLTVDLPDRASAFAAVIFLTAAELRAPSDQYICAMRRQQLFYRMK